MLGRGRRLRAARSTLVCALLLSLISWSAVPAEAAGGQFGSINGTIVDSSSKNAVAGATVTASSPSGTGTATTNSSGFFSMLGLNVDTYTLSIQAKGYDAISQNGITLTGDQTTSLGNVALNKHLVTIARTTARSVSGAFQPTQTTDQYTISGARIEESVGRPTQTNENNVLLSAPGVTLATSGNVTIRGGRLTEVGYQLDGVSFAEPFLSANGSTGLANGLGSVQVVEGAGDASQGLVGSGVINVIPKRGTYPAFGYLSGDMGGPNFYHQFAGEYGFATQNGALSNYITFNGERFNPYRATPANEYGNGLSNSYNSNTQFLDNFVFKFGHGKNQSLQVLYSNNSIVDYGNLGGFNEGPYSASNPAGLAYYPNYPATNALGLPNYANTIGLTPYTPSGNLTPTGPDENVAVNTEFLKFEYDNNLDQNTYLALRYYNWSSFTDNDITYSLAPVNGNTPSWQHQGGITTGGSLDITRQLGSRLTVTANGMYETQHPIWNLYDPTFSPIATNFLNPLLAADGANGPSWSDYQPGGYLSQFSSLLPNGPGRFPSFGINYNGSIFQNFGGGLRFQYNPITPLKMDFGVRYEGQNQHFYNPNNPNNEGGNPFDVPAALWTSNVTNPRDWEPRASISYQIDRNDSLRTSYGRSTVFDNGQDGGTPLGAYGMPAAFYKIPPKPGFSCGTQVGVFFPCSSYGQQFYWALDRYLDAPDSGGINAANYSNYDLTFSHLFTNGWGTRVTPFYKLGTTLPSASLLLTLPNGQQVFSGSSKAFNRTTGVEFNVTTPEKRQGISGFLSATYQNVLQSAPPLSNFEANGTPTLSPATLALGDTYRAGYISPLSMRIGGTYKHGGFSVTPVLQFDNGYPYSVGNLIAGQVGTTATGAPIYANVPQVNFGAGEPIIVGFYQASGAQLATNYYDPAYSGTTTNPNIAFTRGTPATSNSGGKLFDPNLSADLTLQYKVSRNTFGVQLSNLFGNAFNGSIPLANPFYQPVATGLSGPMTNVNSACAGVTGHGCSATIPKSSDAFQNGAYLLSNGNIAGYQLAPLTPFNVQFFYSLAL
jgi:hypothetical protein